MFSTVRSLGGRVIDGKREGMGNSDRIKVKTSNKEWIQYGCSKRLEKYNYVFTRRLYVLY